VSKPYVSNPSHSEPEPEFDPFAYHADYIKNPEKYISMAKIVAEANATRPIRKAETLEALTATFQPLAKAAKAAGNTEVLGWLTDAARRRKKELEEV